MSPEHRHEADDRPQWLINIQSPGTSPSQLEVDGKTYTYTTIKSGLEPELPFAVGYPTDTALMIAEDAPEAYVPFVLTHEVRENNRFKDLPKEVRCLAALEAELDDVKTQAPDLYEVYVKDRYAFFKALVRLYENPDQATAVTVEFILGIQKTKDYLEDLVAHL